jgi:hypothetical protein
MEWNQFKKKKKVNCNKVDIYLYGNNKIRKKERKIITENGRSKPIIIIDIVIIINISGVTIKSLFFFLVRVFLNEQWIGDQRRFLVYHFKEKWLHSSVL